MKNFLILIFSVILVNALTSCTENGTLDNNEITYDVSSLTTSIGGYWNTPCENETWDGVNENPCTPDPTNCVVVCAEKIESPEFTNFVNNVNLGTAADYYENGNGQTFMPLDTAVYNDLINGLVDIVKVPAGNHQYAVVSVIN